jgi:hypothetical protein
MMARRVVAAQREAARQRGAPPVVTSPPVAAPIAAPEIAAPQIAALHITWGELGCPRETGLYRAAGGPGQVQGSVRVKWIHLLVAEDDPSALFTVVTLHPPLGPAEFVLGHRLA